MVFGGLTVTAWEIKKKIIIHLPRTVFCYFHTAGKVREKKSVKCNTVRNVCLRAKCEHTAVGCCLALKYTVASDQIGQLSVKM